MREPKATIDFETRSACSIKRHGSWVYSLHPTTEVLCMAFRLPHWEEGRTGLWTPETGEDSDLFELLDWVVEGGLVEAHNAWFERGIWQNLLVLRYGWPTVGSAQWRCSAAKAAAHSLPRSLSEACTALSLSTTKDAGGHKAMKKMASPRKPRKAEREAGVTGLLWWDSPELRTTLHAYCRQDVLAEEGLSSALDDLNTQETSVYLLDQVINERGFQLDRPAVDAALALISKETQALNTELSTLTGGCVTKATQRAKMLGWFEQNGLDLDDTQKETIDGLDHTALSAPVSRAITILRALGRSSTAKYQRMDDWMCPDARVRGGLLYHGAGTGRWSGAGVQPHNFPKGTVKDQEALWHTLKGQDRTQIGAEYSGVMEALSNGLRGTIIASAGKDLYVADYASIEARVVMWLAEEDEALDFFRTGGDIYLDMAAEIYNKECYSPSPERQVGKFAILGLGFQMGAPKFQGTCEKFGVKIEEEFAVRVVEAYRGKYWRVKQMWTDQEDAALQAVRTKQPVQCGYVTWLREGHFLFCELPSGRRLAYPYPEIRARETPWGAVKASLTFMGIDTYTRKWKRQVTYGGSLVENITQAVARDIMAEAMLRCEEQGYEVALTVHDEIVTENAQGNVAEFVQILTTVPEWAVGLPVEAAGFVAKRYKK